jgi:hypothetical protein
MEDTVNESMSAIKIINDALTSSGAENVFDYPTKCMLILIVEAALRAGYVQGYEACKSGKQPSISREQLIEFRKLYKSIQG